MKRITLSLLLCILFIGNVQSVSSIVYGTLGYYFTLVTAMPFSAGFRRDQAAINVQATIFGIGHGFYGPLLYAAVQAKNETPIQNHYQVGFVCAATTFLYLQGVGCLGKFFSNSNQTPRPKTTPAPREWAK